MMVLLDHEMEWFRSEQGVATFNNISKLEDRIYFIMAFLKSVMRESDIADKLHDSVIKDYEIERINECSSSFAIFLADAIFDSDLPYATYPELIDPQKNPFLNYWISIKFGGDLVPKSEIFEYFSSIIYKENQKNRSVNSATFQQQLKDGVDEKCSEETFELFFKILPDTSIHDLTPSLQLVQLKNIWLYG